LDWPLPASWRARAAAGRLARYCYLVAAAAALLRRAPLRAPLGERAQSPKMEIYGPLNGRGQFARAHPPSCNPISSARFESNTMQLVNFRSDRRVRVAAGGRAGERASER